MSLGNPRCDASPSSSKLITVGGLKPGIPCHRGALIWGMLSVALQPPFGSSWCYFTALRPNLPHQWPFLGGVARVRLPGNSHCSGAVFWESHVTLLSVSKKPTAGHVGPYSSLKSLSPPHHPPNWTKSRLGWAGPRRALRHRTAASRVCPAPHFRPDRGHVF